MLQHLYCEYLFDYKVAFLLLNYIFFRSETLNRCEICYLCSEKQHKLKQNET